MRATLVILSLGLVACGPAASTPAGASSSSGGEVASNQNAPAPEPHVSPSSPTEAPREAPAAGLGTGRETPVLACGPADSYRRVAEHRCADGTQPLGGDVAAGQQARQGNVGANSRGHVIDRYRIPCSAGGVDLYVDMYGCPEMQQMLGGE